MNSSPFSDELKKILDGAARIAIVGIGDELSVADRLGMQAAHQLAKKDLRNTMIFLAGTVPESITGPVRRFRPDRILLLDAADTGARPGTISVISREHISGNLLSTHAMPLSAVMEFMEADTSAAVTLLGIQPDLSRPDCGLSQEGYRRFDQYLNLLAEILENRRLSEFS